MPLDNFVRLWLGEQRVEAGSAVEAMEAGSEAVGLAAAGSEEE